MTSSSTWGGTWLWGACRTCVKVGIQEMDQIWVGCSKLYMSVNKYTSLRIESISCASTDLWFEQDISAHSKLTMLKLVSQKSTIWKSVWKLTFLFSVNTVYITYIFRLLHSYHLWSWTEASQDGDVGIMRQNEELKSITWRHTSDIPQSPWF